VQSILIVLLCDPFDWTRCLDRFAQTEPSDALGKEFGRWTRCDGRRPEEVRQVVDVEGLKVELVTASREEPSSGDVVIEEAKLSRVR
jgi:hypothetical protein